LGDGEDCEVDSGADCLEGIEGGSEEDSKAAEAASGDEAGVLAGIAVVSEIAVDLAGDEEVSVVIVAVTEEVKGVDLVGEAGFRAVEETKVMVVVEDLVDGEDMGEVHLLDLLEVVTVAVAGKQCLL